jgi:hypothetical protein
MKPRPLFGVFVPAGLIAFLLGCNSNNSAPPASSNAAPRPAAEAANANAPGYFANVTERAGIKFIYKNGEEAGHFAILESLGGGVGVIDYDRDGKLDLFFPGGGYFTPDKQLRGHPCALFRNEGDWKFREVTKEAGLDKIDFYTHGAAVSDYDNDGWPDLLVTGYGRLALFHNEKGRFADVTVAAGFPIEEAWHWSTSAAFADLNADGFADLYVTHYVNWSLTKNHPKCDDTTGRAQDVCSPKRFDGLPDQLFLNNGKGGFVDVSKEAVEENGALRPLKASKGLGVVIVDVNRDGRPDIYVANDTVDNFLYVNQGQMKFREMGMQMGVARDEHNTPNGSMGVGAADYDGTGNFSLFVTNYQHEAHQLYRNTGTGMFGYASSRARIQAIGLIYVAFGTGFFDYDHDGAEDIFILNGHVVRHPPPPGTLKQRPVLLRNLRQPGQKPFEVQFDDVTGKGGPFFFKYHLGRGLAFADLDNDGKVDVIACRMNEPMVLLRNETKSDNTWLGIELEGKQYKDAVNALLSLEIEVEVNGQKQTQVLNRQILGGGSYLSASDHRVVFGLNSALKAKPKALTIQWPSATKQTIRAGELKVGQYQKISEAGPAS